MGKTKEFTREELHDLVWSKSLRSIANEYRISDNGLRKICKKYNIPLPKMGHWQKVQHGKKVQKDKFIESEKWKDAKIVLSDREAGEKDHYLSRLARLTKEIEEQCADFINVPEHLTKPDPLIRTAKDFFKNEKARKSWRGFIETISTRSGIVSISVTKENVPRALRIMDTFIKLARERDHKIEINGHETILTVSGERYKIRLREKHTRKIIEEDHWNSSELVPNGILSINLDDFHNKEWKDGKIPLENQMSKIIATFELRAEDDKIERARWEAYREEQRRLEAIRKREAAIAAWEKKKIDLLVHHANQWNTSQRLLSFIQETEKLSSSSQTKVSDWIEWAKKHATKLNPLIEGVESFVDEYDFPED